MRPDDRLTPLGNNFYLFTAKAPEPLLNKNQTRNSSQRIINYGKNNDYPQELIRALMSSPIASGCAETQAKYIYGDGFIYPETEFGKTLRKIFTNDFLQRIAYDTSYFNAFTFQPRFNLNGNLYSVNHVDFSTVRLGELAEDNVIRFARLSADWEQNRKKEFMPVDLDLFDPIRIKATIADFQKRQAITEFEEWHGALYYAKRYKPGETYYPRPKYASALKWIYADGEIQTFHANNLDNGFMPSVILYVPFDLDGKTEDGTPKKEKLKQDIEERTGAKAGGKPFIIYGKDKDSVPQVIQFSANTNHELFIALSDLIRDNIASAFQIPPILAGIQVSGKLGASNEIANSIEMYTNGVIKHDVAFIEGELNKLMPFVEGYTGAEDEKLTISNAKPFNFIDPAYKENFTDEEIRAANGYGPRKTVVTEEGVLSNG